MNLLHPAQDNTLVGSDYFQLVVVVQAMLLHRFPLPVSQDGPSSAGSGFNKLFEDGFKRHLLLLDKNRGVVESLSRKIATTQQLNNSITQQLNHSTTQP